MKAGPRTERVLLHAFSTFKLGGPQARFVQLANALGPGYRHIVAAMDNCFDAGERLEPEVAWEPLPLNVVKGGALANRACFRAVIHRVQPDLLLSYNWGAIEWAAANFPKVCQQVHVEDGFGPEEAGQQLQRRVWMRRALLGMNRIPIVVASSNLERIATKVWKLSGSRVRFLPNGVELCDESAPPNNEHVVIGTVAGLRPEKNIARLLRAFAEVRSMQNARLVIVGGGPLLSELQQLAGELHISSDVEFTGYLKDPSSRLLDWDIFALSSDTEQLPLAMLEAMAAGLPVVATNVGDIGEVLRGVSEENLAPPDDVAFAEVLARAIGRRDRWPAWADAGRRKVSAQYSLSGMVARWKSVYDGQYN